MSGLEYLHGIESVLVDDGSRPIRTSKAGIIAVVGTAGKGPVNTNVLINGNPRKAAEIFGADMGDGFTLPESFDAIFGFGGATVVAVNVLDPTKHKTDVTGQVITVPATGGVLLGKTYVSAVTLAPTAGGLVATTTLDTPITLPSGAAVTNVKSSDGATTYALNTDYEVVAGVLSKKAGGSIPAAATVKVTYTIAPALTSADFTVTSDTGLVTLTRGRLLKGTQLLANYTYNDPTKVTLADVVGGVAAGGVYTGVNVLREAPSTVFVTPRILTAPGFTSEKPDALTANPVATELLGVADRLKAIVYADAPNTTPEDAINYRKDYGSKRIVVLDPYVKVLNPKNEYVYRPRSAFRAGLAARVIRDHGWHVLPSNHPLEGVVGMARNIEGPGKDTEANYLNENEVATLVRTDGFREWGGRTCSDDPKWAFESVVRIADMIQEAIVLAHQWAVDRNITKNLVGSIVESVNAYLRQLKAQDVVLGGKCWADVSLNTPESIMDGRLYIDFEFTPPYPAEHIVFRAHLVNSYITELLVGLVEEGLAE